VKNAVNELRPPAFLQSVTVFSLFSLGVFFCYRLAFLHHFASEFAIGQFLSVWLNGLRLDFALLGGELALTLILFALTGRPRIHPLTCALFVFAYLHLFVCLAAYLFFVERNQQMGEMLFAFITSPQELYQGIRPFLSEAVKPLLWSILMAMLFVAALRRVTADRSTTQQSLWKDEGGWRYGLLLVMGIVLLYEPIYVTNSRSGLGFRLVMVASHHYTRQSDYYLNEAIINPIFEMLRIHLPAFLMGDPGNQLSSKEAMAVVATDLGLPFPPGDWPLLRTISSTRPSAIQNVVILQIEGLSASLVGLSAEGREVLPFINRLASRGLYFPHCLQSFNATAGGVFAVATGMHKSGFDEKTKRFSAREMNAFYGSLPHILAAEGYQAWYFQGFLQSSTDFAAFMGKQGFQFTGHDEFLARLTDKQGAEGPLGLHDGPMLEEAARILLAAQSPYVAHVMTGSTHSPWGIPEGEDRPFSDATLNTFHYLDKSLTRFVTILEEDAERFSRTLFVVVADHTSITPQGASQAAMLFVPLIFAGPFPLSASTRLEPVSQVDIIPTILALLGGGRSYAGFGENLLGPLPGRKLISGGLESAFLIDGNYALRYTPSTGNLQLLLFEHASGAFSPADGNGGLERELLRGYLAHYETARHLSLENRIFPPALAKPSPGNPQARQKPSTPLVQAGL